MALIKCKECGHDVSDKADACPNCGAKVQKPAQQVGCGTIVGVVFLVGFLIAVFSGSSSSDKGSGTAADSQECKKDDLQCLGDKGVIAAGVYCQDQIEKHAMHSVKWTDGTFETKFSRFRWKDKANGIITYIGDKAEFQNGFGAFTPVIYECDLGTDQKTVLDVRVTEGRLP